MPVCPAWNVPVEVIVVRNGPERTMLTPRTREADVGPGPRGLDRKCGIGRHGKGQKCGGAGESVVAPEPPGLVLHCTRI